MAPDLFNGQPMRDEWGKVVYTPTAQFRDRVDLECFTEAALAALDLPQPGWSA